MAKPTDTETILLAHASQHPDSSLYPLSEMLAGNNRASGAISALIKHNFAEERTTSKAATVSRTDGDLRFGVFVIEAGLAAIGVTDESDGGDTGAASALRASAPAMPRDSLPTKTSMVLVLLQQDDGATMAELVEATGWLQHTTRASLTGLRRKGHTVDRYKRDDVTCYRIEALHDGRGRRDRAAGYRVSR